MSNRQKLWHRKSRSGCGSCKQRRIKCDEAKPECKNCVKRQSACIYREAQNLSVPVTQASSHSLQHTKDLGWACTTQNEVEDFDFYLRAGATNCARWHFPHFWTNILPQASWSHSSVRHCLFAISAITQQYLCTTEAEVQTVLRRGAFHYTKACQLLTYPPDRSPLPPEAALVASLALFTFDWFAGRRQQSFVHANAAIRLFSYLQSDDHSDAISPWQYGTSVEGRQHAIEFTQAFFRDLHFPLNNAKMQIMLAARSQQSLVQPCHGIEESAAIGSISIDPTHRDRPDVHSTSLPRAAVNMSCVDALSIRTPPYDIEDILSMFWAITTARTTNELKVCLRTLDDREQEARRGPLPATREQQMLINRIALFKALCRVHLQDTIDPITEEAVDKQCAKMLDLIRADLRLIGYQEIVANDGPPSQLLSPSHIEQQFDPNTRGYLGALGIVAKRTKSHTVRSQAFDLMSLHRWNRHPSFRMSGSEYLLS